MNINNNQTPEKILLSDEQLNEVIGGAQVVIHPNWLKR